MGRAIEWRQDQEQSLKRLWPSHLLKEISALLGFGPGVIARKAAAMGLPPKSGPRSKRGEEMSNQSMKRPQQDKRHEAKPRKCLGCRREFHSAWFGDRVCGTCKNGRLYQEGESPFEGAASFGTKAGAGR